MRSSFTIAACALALSCGGAVLPDGDGDADASADPDAGGVEHDASFLLDTGDILDTGPRLIDAGTIDGAEIRCGEVNGGPRYCRTPQEYCCIDQVPEGFVYRCASASAPIECAVTLYCDDDPAECADGGVCCVGGETFGGPISAGCSTKHCHDWKTAPNTWAEEMCDPDAGTDADACPPNTRCRTSLYRLPGYSTCW